MENRFEHFSLDIFNISRYWNKIATDEMKKYSLRGTHALYLLMLDGYEGEITAARLADLCQRDKADVSRALADFQKKRILEPYSGPRYRATPKLTPLGRSIASQIRARATVALDLAGQGITEEMRQSPSTWPGRALQKKCARICTTASISLPPTCAVFVKRD